MSKDFVYHQDSLKRRTGYLFNNPYFPSGTEAGRIRDDIYTILSAKRDVDDQAIKRFREKLNEVFPAVYERVVQQGRSGVVFSYQRTIVEVAGGGGSLSIAAETPEHNRHEFELVDSLVSVVPHLSIERSTGLQVDISRHEAWAPAAGMLAIIHSITE